MITFLKVNITAHQMVLNHPVLASLDGSQAAVSPLEALIGP